MRLARRAAELGREDAVALAAAGFALVTFGETRDGAAVLERALAANPNLAWAWHMSGFAQALSGHAGDAVEHAMRAIRLSPQDPQGFAMQAVVGLGHFLAGSPAEALRWSEAAVRERDNFVFAVATLAASAAQAGHAAQATGAMQRLRELAPDLRVGNLEEWLKFSEAEDFHRWKSALAEAGLPP